MKRVLLALVFVISGLFANAKNTYLELTGIVKGVKSGLQDVQVSVFDNEKLVNQTNCNEKGRFKIDLDSDKDYKLVIEKKGFYQPVVAFNTQGLNCEEGKLTFKFALNLYPVVDGFKGLLLEKPIMTFHYDMETDDMERIQESTNTRAIDTFLSYYKKSINDVYSNIVNQADSAFILHNFNLAKQLYKQAINYDSQNYYPDDQLAMINRIMEQDARYDRKFQADVEQANLFYSEKDYQKAKKYYRKALKIHNDLNASTRIKLIENELLPGNFFAEN